MEAVANHALVTCMGLPGQEIPLKGKFTADQDGKKSFWIEINTESFTANEALLETVLGKADSAGHVTAQAPFHLKFSVFIREQPVICFEAEFIERKNFKLHFKNPEKMFFLQRRLSKRYRVPAAYEIWIEHTDPHYKARTVKHRLFDLSSGGVSFLVGAGESRFFSPGLKLEPVIFTLKNQKISCEVTVRVVGRELVRLGELNGILIGCQFKELDRISLNLIEDYIEDGFARGQTGRTQLE